MPNANEIFQLGNLPRTFEAYDSLYICNGAASGGTFTAGKFLIEFYGYVA